MSDAAPPAFDQRAFRDALGCFATGVTIVTTRAADGAYVGLTANSFSSVSLDPPLVLWSLDRGANSFDVFRGARHYAINVLARDQAGLSSRFARQDDDKFAGVALREGAGGMPLLDGAIAHFTCAGAEQYWGGDHVIFLGRVVDFAMREAPPLLFCRGRYRELQAV